METQTPEHDGMRKQEGTEAQKKKNLPDTRTAGVVHQDNKEEEKNFQSKSYRF